MRRPSYHPIRSADITLSSEGPGDFDAHLRAFRAEHNPITPTEQYLVERLAVTSWSAQRISRMHTGFLDHLTGQAAQRLRREREDTEEETQQETPAGRHAEDTLLLGMAVLRDSTGANATPKLSTCQARAERSFIMSLRQLRDLRNRRTAAAAPASAARS